jgi:hypothetical protein
LKAGFSALHAEAICKERFHKKIASRKISPFRSSRPGIGNLPYTVASEAKFEGLLSDQHKDPRGKYFCPAINMPVALLNLTFWPEEQIDEYDTVARDKNKKYPVL